MEANISAYQDNRTVEELAQHYAIYTAAMWLSQWYLPILVPFGLVGNTLSFLVMIMPHNRPSSCCNFMAALSVSDNCMMYLAIHVWVVTSGIARPVTFYECKIIAYAFNLFSVIGIYLIVFMTLDRFIAVKFPLKMNTLCTAKRARITIAVICVTAGLYTAPYIYTSGIINKTLCSTLKGKTMFTQTYSWINIMVSSVMPFVSLLGLNTVIIRSLNQRRKNLDSLGSRKQGQNSDTQLAVMLVLISFAFLFLTLPVCIRYILAIMLDHDNNPYHNSIYAFVYHFSQKLYFTNNAVNFYLYCIGGTKFRHDLTQMFKKKTNKHGSDAGNGKLHNSKSSSVSSVATMCNTAL